MLTAFSISSMPLRMRIALRCERAPYSPMPNKAAASIKGYDSGMLISALLPSTVVAHGDDDGADERNKQQHGRELKRNDEVREQRPADHAHRVAAQARRSVAPADLAVNDHHAAHDGQHRQAG